VMGNHQSPLRPLEFEPTIPNLIRRGAERFADRDFVVNNEGRLTYSAADAESRRLAKQLLARGVNKGTHVGMLFSQGPDFVVVLLAITRIGAVAVPLSTFLRGPELRRTVRHADVGTLIAPRTLLGRDLEAEFKELWPELEAGERGPHFIADAPFLRDVWLLDGTDDVPPISDEVLDAVESEVRPSDRMVIVSTSGATAEPKAVVHTHGAQVRQAWKLAQLYEFTGEERTFTTMPFFWVGGLTVSLLSHLHVGAMVVTVARTDSGAMLDVIEQNRVTRLVGWTVSERLAADPTYATRDLSSIVEVHPKPDPRMRHNSLGMSETSGPHTVASASASEVDLPEEHRGSFGPPIDGMQHKIVDPETGASLPDGTEGELCVRGDCLMDAIYKKERRDTFDEDGWYHTGDKGYFCDGLLFFTGRLTEMIKTGGANVAPREVELVVESLPGVKAAFVVGVPDAERGEVVGCLVCPDEGCDIDPAALTQELATMLSSYKVPRRFRVLPYDDAPWLPSGKISKPRIVELFVTS
jgi:acyl-CoA synthetase (AMP-forming)/AMP-acid ligase II